MTPSERLLDTRGRSDRKALITALRNLVLTDDEREAHTALCRVDGPCEACITLTQAHDDAWDEARAMLNAFDPGWLSRPANNPDPPGFLEKRLCNALGHPSYPHRCSDFTIEAS